MNTVFFEVESARPLRPLGVCCECGVREDPTIAIFWSQNAAGELTCPECSGEMPTDGYNACVLYKRNDRFGEMETRLGPYSAAEAQRTAEYLLQLDNVKSARVAPKELA